MIGMAILIQRHNKPLSYIDHTLVQTANPINIPKMPAIPLYLEQVLNTLSSNYSLN